MSIFTITLIVNGLLWIGLWLYGIIFQPVRLDIWNTFAGFLGLVITEITLYNTESLKEFGLKVFHKTISFQDGKKYSLTLYLCEHFHRCCQNREWVGAIKFGREFAHHLLLLANSTQMQKANKNVKTNARRIGQMVDDIFHGHKKPTFSITAEQWTQIVEVHKWLSSVDKALLESFIKEAIDAE